MGGDATQPTKRLGAWAVRADSTVYQAATDGFVHAIAPFNVVASGYTDGANPPVSVRVREKDVDNGCQVSLTFAVRKNDYWETVNCTDSVRWIPLEP